jgi:4-amino-4-deoxy-L-arabinose transferase-like glycosyltransferase
MGILGLKMKSDRWLILIILLGLVLRLVDIVQPYIGLSGWNEAHYSLAPVNYFKYGLLEPMNDYGLDLSTTPILYWAIYASFKIFGISEWSARIPSLISGIISIWLIYLIAQRLYDREVAYLGSFIVATAPGIVYFSRSVQLESMLAMFSLGALLSLLYFGDTKKVGWYIAAIFFLSLSLLIKLPAILIYPALLWIWIHYVDLSLNRKNLLRLSIYFLLPLIPALLWIYYGANVTPIFIKTYFIRPSEVPTLKAIFGSLDKAAFEFVPGNLGRLQFYILLAGLPILAVKWKRHMPMVLISTTWLALVIKYPITYLNNWYYDYLALYAMSVLAAYVLVKITHYFRRVLNAEKSSKQLAAILIIIALFNIQGYYDPFHKFFNEAQSQFQTIGEPEPFYSAKFVAKENVDKQMVMVSWPSTMFYSGADPGYVKALHFQDEKIIDSIHEEKYEYIVLYYSMNREIRDILAEKGYEKIAPRAWRRINETPNP